MTSIRPVLLACLMIHMATAYSPETSSSGNPIRRTDASSLKFMVNAFTAAGMSNADGAAIIAAGSDPVAALQAAADSWSNVASSTVKFAPLETTPAINDACHYCVGTGCGGCQQHVANCSY